MKCHYNNFNHLVSRPNIQVYALCFMAIKNNIKKLLEGLMKTKYTRTMNIEIQKYTPQMLLNCNVAKPKLVLSV